MDKDNNAPRGAVNQTAADEEAWLPEEDEAANSEHAEGSSGEDLADSDTAEQGGSGLEAETASPSDIEIQPDSAPEAKKLKFTARIDHQDREVELDESEVPALYQKAANHDRAQARLARLEEKLAEAGISEPKRDFKTEMDDLTKAYPDALKSGSLPEEVRRAAIGGKNVTLAYAEFRLRQAEAENRILKQNAKNMSAAPVRGSGGAGAAGDDFVRGFDSGY